MDRDLMIKSIAALIEIVSDGNWLAKDSATLNQARLYEEGVRDGRIADVTLQAVTLARIITQG